MAFFLPADTYCDVERGGCPVLERGLFWACACLVCVYLGFCCIAGGPEPMGLNVLWMADPKMTALCEVVKLPQSCVFSVGASKWQEVPLWLGLMQRKVLASRQASFDFSVQEINVFLIDFHCIIVDESFYQLTLLSNINIQTPELAQFFNSVSIKVPWPSPAKTCYQRTDKCEDYFVFVSAASRYKLKTSLTMSFN